MSVGDTNAADSAFYEGLDFEDTPSQIDVSVGSRSAPLRSSANLAMERYAQGQAEAFSELYDLLAPKLYAFLCRQTRDPVRADDLLQQTMLQIHRLRGRFRSGGDVTAWAYAIARRFLIDSYRRRSRESAHARIASESSYSGPPTDDLVDTLRLRRNIDAELRRLPEAQRTAFELVMVSDLSYAEVAEMLGTTSNAVKLRVHRAYSALRSMVRVGDPSQRGR